MARITETKLKGISPLVFPAPPVFSLGSPVSAPLPPPLPNTFPSVEASRSLARRKTAPCPRRCSCDSASARTLCCYVLSIAATRP